MGERKKRRGGASWDGVQFFRIANDGGRETRCAWLSYITTIKGGSYFVSGHISSPGEMARFLHSLDEEGGGKMWKKEIEGGPGRGGKCSR